MASSSGSQSDGLNTQALNAAGGEDPGNAKGKQAAVPEVSAEKNYGPPVRATVKKGKGSYYSGALKALGEFNPENITYEQMYMMRRDPMIALGLKYLKAPLLNAPWKIQSKDLRQAAFVENALKAIYTPLLLAICTKFEFGHAGIIKTFERIKPDWTFIDENGTEQDVWPSDTISAVVWGTPRVLPPETVEPAFTQDGQQFDGLSYKPGPLMKDPKASDNAKAGETELIPVGHALWAINEREDVFGNWAGWPRTGYAFRYWYSYWYNYILADKHFEQDADPPAKVSYPPGKTYDAEVGEEVDNAAIALQMGDLLREGATLAFPSDTWEDDLGKPSSQKKWDFDFVKGGENLDAYLNRFKDLRVMKLRGLLVPEQALIEGQSGNSSRNAAASYGAIFAESLGIEMAVIDFLINRYMIPDLLAINFAEPAVCTKVTTGFRTVDTTFANTLLSYIANQSGKDLPIDIFELLDMTGIPTTRAVKLNDPTDNPEDQPPDPADGEVPDNAPAMPGQPAAPPPGGQGGNTPPPPNEGNKTP